MNEAFQLQDRKKKKHRQIHARWMGIRLLTKKPIKSLHGNFHHSDGVKLWCKKCDSSMMHFPVFQYFKQKKNKLIPSKRKTSLKKVMLKCEKCGSLQKNVKKLAY